MSNAVRGLAGLTTLLAVGALVIAPSVAPLFVIPPLGLALFPLVRAYRAARGTALRASVVWGFVAVLLGLATEATALAEPLRGGRPMAGHLAYLTAITTLAALVSVLNARTPGGGAWAILMSLLLLVFLIPWLEGAGLQRAGHGLRRLRLDAPWSLFYGLLVIAGVTNYLPTRFGPAAACLGLGLIVEYLALTRTDASPASRAALWQAYPACLAAAATTASFLATPRHPSSEVDGPWLWFRDHWGVVWALRVLERFNQTAASQAWPVRLAWGGLVAAPGVEGEITPTAEAKAILTSLLRRFVTPARLAEAVDPPCQAGDGLR